ncbi:helix-turn-helix transcriptional regulator [Allorhizocola rhizosphaerae]|uniref:helix-turn-helix transcriptional regulator n=1 Tax=Allorhizocola rhizosphaerae TaxID=1872709 RepID=UPI000E3B8C6C|nr:YafY family protein [Allorhizocola rhizosphaerae]
MLRLLSLLQTHRYWPGGELARRLAVSERTLRRDIDRLRELGYPVEAGRGVAGGYQLRSGAAMPPLLLDDDEAVAIAVALRGSAHETAAQALAKVVQVMPARLQRRVDAVRDYSVPAVASGQSVDAAALGVLALACRDGERLRFAYPSGPRHVEPHRLVSVRHRWYLVAWDLDRGDWRSFRVDRLRDPVTTGARFRQREFDAAGYVLRERPTRHRIEVVVHAGAEAVEKVTAQTGGRVFAIDDGSCRLVLDVDEFDWPVLILTAIEAEFEVVEPASFRSYLHKLTARMGRATARSR